MSSDPIATEIEEPKAPNWDHLPSLYAKRRERRVAEESDLTPISSHLPPAARSAASSASTSSESASSSAATGARSLAPRPSSSTGISLSRIDAAMLLPVEQAWAERDSEALESRLYRSLKPVRTCLQPLSDANHELVGYERVGEMDAGSLENLRLLASRITAPAGPAEAVKMITRLLQATKSRDRDGQDIRGMIAVLAEDLAEFPVDVLATACRKHARQEKWWPSLSELREQCHRANRWRRSFAKAVAA